MVEYEYIMDGDGNLKRNGITWIASWPKSGNTWVRLFLAAYIKGSSNFSITKKNFSGDSQMYAYQAVSPVPVQMLSELEKWRLRDAALAHQFYASTKTNLLLKTHTANAMVNDRWLIPKDLTHKVIYILRDPRDVLVSWRRYAQESWAKAYETLTNKEGILYSKHPMAIPTFMSSWGKHVESWTNSNTKNVAVARYESLLNHPLSGFRKLLEFLEIEVDEERLSDAVQLTQLDSLKDMESRSLFIENQSKQPFFHKGGSRWKDELPPEYAEKVVNDFGDLMKQFDYT